MQAPLKDKNDIKIFILYLLWHVHYPLDFSTVNDIVVQDGVVGYFDFAECFAELLETGNIAEETRDGTCLYRITEQGIRVAENLQSKLLVTIREKSLKSAMRLLSFRKRGSKVSCSSEDLGDGTYQFHCSITEEGRTAMELSLHVDTPQLLSLMKYNFNDRPEVIYRGILAILSGEVNYLID